MYLDAISIKNYRGLGKIELDELSPITVLVGRNNTSKSAFLEAVTLLSTGVSAWHDVMGNDVIEPIVKRRGGWKFVETMIKMGIQEASIMGTHEKQVKRLLITKNIEKLPDNARNEILSRLFRYIENSRKKIIKDIESRLKLPDSELEFISNDFSMKSGSLIADILDNSRLFFHYSENGTKGRSYYAVLPEHDIYNLIQRTLELIASEITEKYIIDEEHFRRAYFGRINVQRTQESFRSTSLKKSNTLFLGKPSTEYLKELHNRLAKSGEIIPVIDGLSQEINYLRDLREVDENLLVYLKNLKKPIPLEAMGDGFRAELVLLFAISNLKQGLILLEEPESCLHPGYMSSVVKQIIQTASKKNVQYIIATHSSDFLEFLLKKTPELTRVVRMYRMEEEPGIDYEVISGEEAKEELDGLQQDLRGV